jgi:hypothetical protein
MNNIASMFESLDYVRPEMELLDIFGLLPLCASPEDYHEGDEGDWLDGED